MLILHPVRPTHDAPLATQDLARTGSDTARWCGATQSPSAARGGAGETAHKSAESVEEVSSQVLPSVTVLALILLQGTHSEQ